jgi:biopolymer transport protein ExbD
MRKKRLRRSDDEAQINITPMLDKVFIMFIFFIVTTSFVKEFGIDVNRPSNTPIQEQQQSEVIAVRIDANDQIYVQERLVDIRAVRANIESGLAQQPEAAVVVIADRLANAGLLVRVVDQARVAGAERVSLAARAR